MFGHYTYLGLTLIFTLPLILFLWWRHGRRLWRSRRLIFLATVMAVVYGFFVWPFGLRWHCWGYSEEHILGMRIFGTVLEDLVWWACIAFLFSSFITVAAAAEEKGWPVLRTVLTSEPRP
jgi:lycopene cyclase domain-containing protein